MTSVQQWGVAPAGYRLPDATRIGRVRLQVADLQRSLEWYGHVLGFRMVEQRARFAALGLPDGTVLVELQEKPGVASVARRPRLGLYHYAILLPDRAALGRFVAHLGEIGAQAGASDHFVSEALYLSDPDGLGIEVYADRPRSSWRHRERELVMATEPLDIGDVVRAGAGEHWQGMPDGTVIGHVHLHVRDIESAAAFYHDALGFDKVVWSYPGALFLSAGGYHHHLGTNTWAAGAAPAGADDARLLEWELILPTARDVAAASASLASAGHPAADGLVLDPWGTALRIVAG